jgi:ABC-2 type transport system permease protein
MVRGVIVGGLSVGVLSFFMPLPFLHSGYVLYFAVMGSLMLSLLGLVTGVWGRDFDQFGAVQNFIVMPATFLSGSFFSVSSLPHGWRFLCTLNPFFYMIDGFRYGFTGYADGDLWSGIALLFIMNLVLFNIAYWMFASGTRLKT